MKQNRPGWNFVIFTLLLTALIVNVFGMCLNGRKIAIRNQPTEERENPDTSGLPEPESGTWYAVPGTQHTFSSGSLCMTAEAWVHLPTNHVYEALYDKESGVLSITPVFTDDGLPMNERTYLELWTKKEQKS